MFYFHLSIGGLEYLVLSNSLIEFVFIIYRSFLIYHVPQMQLRFPGTLMQNKVFIISHSFCSMFSDEFVSDMYLALGSNLPLSYFFQPPVY